VTSIDEASGAVGGNADQARELAGGITASKDVLDSLIAAMSAVGLENKVSEAQAASDRAEELTGQANGLADALDTLRTQIEALKTLLAASAASSSSPSPSSVGSARKLGGSAQSWKDLADFRARSGLPVAGAPNDRDTAAKIEIGGKSFFGRNAHKRTIDIKVNSITRTHAEADVFQQLKDAGNTTRHATLYVDRDLCPPCGPSGGVGSLMRGAGVEQLTVHSPSGTFTIDATKRPSRPVAAEEDS
jgi:hypothetical protein